MPQPYIYFFVYMLMDNYTVEKLTEEVKAIIRNDSKQFLFYFPGENWKNMSKNEEERLGAFFFNIISIARVKGATIVIFSDFLRLQEIAKKQLSLLPSDNFHIIGGGFENIDKFFE